MSRPIYDIEGITLIQGDARQVAQMFTPDSMAVCITSPPFWGLREGPEGGLGDEGLLEDYVANIVAVFQGVRTVLRPDGVLFLNLGDSYYNYRTGNKGGMPPNSFHNGRQNGRPSRERGCNRRRTKQTLLKEKDLSGIPWRVALAMQASGWWLRSDIIWAKPNPMPEKVKTLDRLPRNHEYLFMLTKNQRYAFANEDPALKTVWTIPQKQVKGHHSVFPEELVRRCLALVPSDGVVFDPFCGSGTVLRVAQAMKIKAVGVELDSAMCQETARRLEKRA